MSMLILAFSWFLVSVVANLGSDVCAPIFPWPNPAVSQMKVESVEKNGVIIPLPPNSISTYSVYNIAYWGIDSVLTQMPKKEKLIDLNRGENI